MSRKLTPEERLVRKEQRRAYKRRWYLANREQVLAVNQAYREKNPELVARLKREWADANKEKLKTQRSQRRRKNLEKHRAYEAAFRKTGISIQYQRNYYKQNRGLILDRSEKWRQQNRERFTERTRTRGIIRWLGIANWTWDEYDIRHSRGCEICGGHGGETPKTGLCFDHDHETGKVRGLLCARCNRFLDWAIGFHAEIGAYNKRTKAA